VNSVPTIFRIENQEVARLPLAIQIGTGARIILGGEYEGRDLRVYEVWLDLREQPALNVDLGEQTGPALTPA
jgi:hypothetical protein